MSYNTAAYQSETQVSYIITLDKVTKYHFSCRNLIHAQKFLFFSSLTFNIIIDYFRNVMIWNFASRNYNSKDIRVVIHKQLLLL